MNHILLEVKERDRHIKKLLDIDEAQIPYSIPSLPKYERQESGVWVEEGGLLNKFWRRLP